VDAGLWSTEGQMTRGDHFQQTKYTSRRVGHHMSGRCANQIDGLELKLTLSRGTAAAVISAPPSFPPRHRLQRSCNHVPLPCHKHSEWVVRQQLWQTLRRCGTHCRSSKKVGKQPAARSHGSPQKLRRNGGKLCPSSPSMELQAAAAGRVQFVCATSALSKAAGAALRGRCHKAGPLPYYLSSCL
jgi:hypothetical protein